MGKALKSVGSLAGGVVGSGLSAATPSINEVVNAIGGPKYTVDAWGASDDLFAPTSEDLAYKELLRKRALGQVPSAAEMQLKQAADRATAQSFGMAKSFKGTSPAFLQKAALQTQADAASQLSRDAAILRAQEQQAAESAYGSELTKEAQSRQNLAQLRAQTRGDVERIKAGQVAAEQENRMRLISGLGQGLATLSDKEEKKNIKLLKEKELKEMLKDISPSKFEYKDENKEGAGKGTFVGVMAQDLEKSKLTKDLVKDTKDGKKVDFGKAIGTILASQSVLNEEIEKIKKLLDKKK